jgi:23S rRNA maturation-related 3'-5' exoribonuclease YhaM
MNKWLELSGSLYLFGENSVNRVEEHIFYLNNGERSDYKTALFHKTSQIAVVKESIQEIKEKLNE